jgi:hypothetical protein
MYIGLHVKYPLFSLDFNETLIFRQILEKYSVVKFHENPSNGSRVVPCGVTDRHDEATSRSPQFCKLAEKLHLVPKRPVALPHNILQATETVQYRMEGNLTLQT